MIRFRFAKDEKRYLTLLGEVFSLVASHLPAPAVSHAMRNFGKVQDMLLLEGVRQGLGVAEIARHAIERGHSDMRSLKPFQAHAMVYGSSDTPLRDVELEWLDKLGMDTATADDAWLDRNPMRFAPQTLKAYEAERGPLSPSVPPVDEGIPTNNDDIQKHWAADDEPPLPPPVSGTDQEDTQERPALLDRVRETLQKLLGEGYQPGSWEEMIMRLHLVTGIDAGFLDLQMGTDMGRTVLAQCGIYDVVPGRGIDLNELKKLTDDPAATLSGDSTET